MDAAMRRLVRQRAGECCEYCGLAQEHSPLATLHVEHILPKKHGGTDGSDNLALACIDCNMSKGSNVAGYDPDTGVLTGLFHPRRHAWTDHFEWRGVQIFGRTAIGRTTIAVLNLNSEEQMQLRLQSQS